jgi:predicted TIM-barrel fold metal-dependent hydrolase
MCITTFSIVSKCKIVLLDIVITPIPESKFEYAPNRHLTPPSATVDEFIDFKLRLGITHSVLTHGLSYGDDCTSLKTFVTELGQQQTFGIGVIDPDTITTTELKEMQAAGIRGIRINLYKYGAMHDVENQKKALRDHARVIKEHCPGWSIAFTHTHPEFWRELKPTIEEEISSAGIPLITDHFALLKGASMLPEEHKDDVTKQSGFEDIIELVHSGSLWVKISAPYRVSEVEPTYDDLKPIVRALVNANPERIIWGSDWLVRLYILHAPYANTAPRPHTPRMKVRSKEEALIETPFLRVDDLTWLRSLKSWVSDEEWDLIMVKNPSQLYAR